MEPCVSQQIRLLASKSFIQFGVCNTGDYLCQDLILMNPHDFDLRCILQLSTFDENEIKSDESVFLFQDECSVTQIDDLKAKSQKQVNKYTFSTN